MKKLWIVLLMPAILMAGCGRQKTDAQELTAGAELSIEAEPESPGEMPGYIIYEGGVYFNRGKTMEEQPAGAELIGETVLIPHRFHEGKNLTSNLEGYVYRLPDDRDVICFQYKEWDVDANGGKASPWIMFQLEETYGPVIRYEGEFYLTLHEGWREPTEEELLGTLTPIGGNEWPEEDGQISGDALLGQEEIPFASFGYRLQVFIDGEWVIFEKYE